ncbi:6134_t:CDS:2, partial [Ambispora gerdemannii]
GKFKVFEIGSVKITSAYEETLKGERHFGLEEGKTFYPTHEEFQNPFEYFEKIRPDAEAWGIIKVVPPKEWKPNFTLDTEAFRFKTRVQRVNTMQGETRLRLNYFEQLQKFHAMFGKSLSKLPHLDRAPIDLYLLAKSVRNRSGPQKVSQLKQWAQVARDIKPSGYSKRCTSASKTLKDCFYDYIHPFEYYTQNAKNSSKTNGSNTDDMDIDDNQGTNSPVNQNICGECGQEIYREQLAYFCQGDCEKPFHKTCLHLLNEITRSGNFYCPDCIVSIGNDFGFGEGSEYSLAEFQKKADNFKANYLQKHPPEGETSIEDHIEAEFWRLAQSIEENVDVEYGADINAMDYGSAFPDPELHPLDLYSKHPWNLRNLPRHHGSLLHLIQPEIPGMMVPWLYVGMAFSAFCWHVEDHYTYSINYMHFGETKTWYGIPSSSAERFEEVAQTLVPEFFEKQPDLLNQLTTILSPSKLVKAGVKVVAIDQRPNQFIVTYPRAYHAGFNHGFNMNEAVNFALPDWVPYGQDSINYYKTIARPPVFSHERLLLEHALRNYNNPRIVLWLKEPVEEICNREIQMRHKIRKELKLKEPVYEIFDRDDPHITCVACKQYCALSQVASYCKPAVVCLEHAKEHYQEVCSCGKGCQYLRIRYLDEHLSSLVVALNQTQNNTREWMENYCTYFKETENPKLADLQKLWRQAKSLQMPINLDYLGNFIDKSIDWTERTQMFSQIINEHLVPYSQKPPEFKIAEFLRRNEIISNDVADTKMVNLDEEKATGKNNNEDTEGDEEYIYDGEDQGDEGKRYCFCRNMDGESFMILCERCGTWYHGECVNAKPGTVSTKKKDKWYCDMCQPWEERNIIEEVLKQAELGETMNLTPPFSREFARIMAKIKNWLAIRVAALSGESIFDDKATKRKLYGMGLMWAIPKKTAEKTPSKTNPLKRKRGVWRE